MKCSDKNERPLSFSFSLFTYFGAYFKAIAEGPKRFGRRPARTVRRCPDVIHFAPVCGSLSRHTFRTRVALHRTAENIGIRGRPRVANELVDGLKRLIAPWKANERHRRPDQNWLHPIMRLLRPTDPRPSPVPRFVTRFYLLPVVRLFFRYSLRSIFKTFNVPSIHRSHVDLRFILMISSRYVSQAILTSARTEYRSLPIRKYKSRSSRTINEYVSSRYSSSDWLFRLFDRGRSKRNSQSSNRRRF